MEAAAFCAVGQFGPHGPWIGFGRAADGYQVVVGPPPIRASASRDDLLALVIAYFEDELDEPPEEVAATHAEVAALVRWLAQLDPDQSRIETLNEAVDAIDDGLAADEVVSRLNRCLSEPMDVADRLRRLARG